MNLFKKILRFYIEIKNGSDPKQNHAHTHSIDWLVFFSIVVLIVSLDGLSALVSVITAIKYNLWLSSEILDVIYFQGTNFLFQNLKLKLNWTNWTEIPEILFLFVFCFVSSETSFLVPEKQFRSTGNWSVIQIYFLYATSKATTTSIEKKDESSSPERF